MGSNKFFIPPILNDHVHHLIVQIDTIRHPALISRVSHIVPTLAVLSQGDPCAVVESVKAASDIYTPVSGVVIAVNEDLDADPAVINADPYGDGWLYELDLSDSEELDGLKDAEAYAESMED